MSGDECIEYELDDDGSILVCHVCLKPITVFEEYFYCHDCGGATCIDHYGHTCKECSDYKSDPPYIEECHFCIKCFSDRVDGVEQ